MHPELATIPPTAPVNDAHENVPWDGSEEMFWEAVNRQDSVMLAQVLAAAQAKSVNQKSRVDLGRARRAVEKNPRVSVPDMARACGYKNGDTFAKRMLEQHNVTPCSFRRRVRVVLAKKLLLGTDWESTRIAHECGFTGSPALSAALREDCGMSPSRFRQRAQAQCTCGNGHPCVIHVWEK